jgi:hypothetical protein
MAVQERHKLVAKCLDVGIKGQLHSTPGDTPALADQAFRLGRD